jgi:hypothetical protein
MIYIFRNIETEEIIEMNMRLSEYDDFKENNPHLERYYDAETLPSFGDSTRMSVPGIGQPDARFEREVIGRIKEKVPGNNLHKTHKTKMPREW